MQENKPTVLMVTSWWPTKENPINGIFFREQMECLSDKYNFVVFRYSAKGCFLIPYFFRQIFGKLITLHKENGTSFAIQYSCMEYKPFFEFIFIVINMIRVKLKIIKLDDGVGRFEPQKKLEKLTKKFERALKILIRSLKQTVDLVYGLTAQDMADKCFCLSKALNVPYVLAEHAPFPYPGHIITNLQKSCIENADAHLIISKDKIRQIMLQNIKLGNYRYVGNYVNEETFIFSPFPHQNKTFVIVAANSFYKNYDMFIRTIDKLSAITDKNFSVLIVGFAANKGYSKNTEELVAKVQASKFADKVELIPSAARSEMPKILNRCDAFVMTSIQEGQPVSALEAACCGLPIFSTRCGGVEDYVTESIGRIVPIDDSDLLATLLNDFLDEKIVFDKKHIREVIVSKFGHDAFVKNVSTVFYSLINKAEEE